MPALADNVIVLDNGGHDIKAALVREGQETTPRKYPNAVGKLSKNAPKTGRRAGGLLISSEIYDASSFSGLSFRRPIDRGFIKEWDLQRDIWSFLFSPDNGLNVQFGETCLLVTEPIATPAHNRQAMNELVFEEFGFDAYAAVVPSTLIARHHGITDGLVLDSGFSSTQAVPVLNGVTQQRYARRMSVGGKVLTNQLKEVVSYRSWNMMDEFMIINAVKERVCYIAQDYIRELEDMRKRINGTDAKVVEYVLPDFTADRQNRLGSIKQPGQPVLEDAPTLKLLNERISVPEALFHPSDIGFMQCGLHELIAESIRVVPLELHCRLFSNIVCAGGNCNFSGFKDRVFNEIRSLAPENFEVQLHMDRNPENSALLGGIKLAKSDDLQQLVVTRKEFNEHGHRLATERFYGRPREYLDV
mmetsp:Transcript_10675/g.32681  ORF Transcript_10675/g.32681 Transcript_10675/m.32681 type:complete len:416 (+) Transcript_10675:86-1333(+)